MLVVDKTWIVKRNLVIHFTLVELWEILLREESKSKQLSFR